MSNIYLREQWIRVPFEADDQSNTQVPTISGASASNAQWSRLRSRVYVGEISPNLVLGVSP
jgi:hypothetical protein